MSKTNTWTSAGKRLAQRLHSAAEKNHDLRCMHWAGFKLPPGDMWLEFGDWFGETSYRINQSTWHQFAFHRLNKRPLLLGDRPTPPGQQEGLEQREVMLRIQTLFAECDYWIDIAPEGFQGLVSDFEVSGIRNCHTRWLHSLFRFAWRAEPGSVLAAHTFYPRSLLATAETRAWQDSNARDKEALASEEQNSAFLAIYDQHAKSAAEYTHSDDRYFSGLPCDPFTASALTVEWLLDEASETTPGDEPTTRLYEQEANSPFSVDEHAAIIRIDGKPHETTHEAARMARILVDKQGDWVSMRDHDFTKASETKKQLPRQVRDLIETSKGKGYRLPRR